MQNNIQKHDNKRPLASQQRRRSLRAAGMCASLHTAAVVCLFGGAMQLFIIKLGADDFRLGLLNFATWGGAPFLLIGMSLMQKYGKRKILFLWSGILPACFTIFIVVTPLMVPVIGASSNLLFFSIFTLLLLRSIVDGIGGAAWFPILQDNVPKRFIGRFFGNLRRFWQMSVFISTIFVGLFLGKDSPYWKFFVVFLIGQILFCAKIFFLTRIAEKPRDKNAGAPESIWKTFRNAILEKRIRHFLIYIFLYNTSAFITLPFQIKMLSELGYSEAYIMIATAMISLGAIVTLRFWGMLADRFGNRSVFTFSHAGMIVILLGWLLVGKNSFSAVYIFGLYAVWSIFQSANGIAQTRYMLHLVSPDRQSNIVIINAVINCSLALAPLIGGIFLTISPALKSALSLHGVNNYHMLFIFAAILTFIPHLMRKQMRVPQETPTTEVFVIITRPLRSMFGSFVSFNVKSDGPENDGRAQ